LISFLIMRGQLSITLMHLQQEFLQLLGN